MKKTLLKNTAEKCDIVHTRLESTTRRLQNFNHPMDEQALKNAYKVLVQPSGLTFEALEDTSLLISGLKQEVRLPHSCRNGTCRACLCRLTQGEIRYQIDWPGLTREEKAEGYILPCVAVAQSDLVIEAEHAISLE